MSAKALAPNLVPPIYTASAPAFTAASARKDLSLALVAADSIYSPSVAATRSFGSISLDLANLASGKLDGIISMSNDSADIAAGILLGFLT